MSICRHRACRVARDRIALEVDLTPGVNIASDVIASLDRDGDTAISPMEAQSYGQSVLADLVVELDGRQVPLTLTRVEISAIAELREGMGAIRVQATATIDGSVAGRRDLHLQNDHQPEKSVYLANALVPDTADVRIVRQSRDSRQRDLRIEYTVEPRWPVKVVWLLAGFSVLAGVLVQRARAYRKRAIAVGEKLGVNRDYPVSKGCTSPFAAILAAGLVATVSAQSSPAAQAARQWRQQHERAIVDEFVALLAIPNIASDRANIQRNAEAIARDDGEARASPAAGVGARRRTRSCSARSARRAPRARLASMRTTTASRSIRRSGRRRRSRRHCATGRSRTAGRSSRCRPLDTASIPSRASTPAAPPTTRRRSSRMLAALDAIRAAGLRTKSNIKFVFEGEEEAGSPNLEKIAGREQGALCRRRLADVRRPAAPDAAAVDLSSARAAVVRLDITVYGPRSELHSGHYGNWAPNPALMLARLLASMKDETGPRADRPLLRRHRAAERNRAARDRRSAGHRRGADAAILARVDRGHGPRR